MMHLSKHQNQQDLILKLQHHAKTSPHAIALMTSDTSWTYQDLLRDVLMWQQGFSSLQLSAPVVLCLHRTPRLVSILLALQWCEVPYIPVEPKLPLGRLRAMIEDSRAGLILHDTTHHEAYASLPCKIRAVCDLEYIFKQTPKTSDDKININSKSISYVIYTSGSTGTPKGVCVSRGALNHFLDCMSQYFLKAKDAVLLATTTLSFDIAALELYLPIWQKKTIFLANQAEHKDPIAIQNILKKYPITLMQGTPSFWNMLHYAGWHGSPACTALCGGERLTPETVKHIRPKVKALWNMYGPTEATIWCALKEIKADTAITVGRPIDGMEMWVLDEAMQPVPEGQKGELYISGKGLAEGYMHQAALTKAAFLAHKKALGGRMYKTGDIASLTPSGEFVVLGRVDNQIKLHGYRIELEDIEAHIESERGVRACGVSVHQEQLVAYISKSAAHEYSERALYHKLALELPEFMIPKRFIYLDHLPLNASGKLDRKALPVPTQAMLQPAASPDSREALLIRIWAEALGMTRLGVHDNFFELGGHSLLAARIIAKVQSVFGKSVSMQDIYHAPSVAAFIEILNATPDISARPSDEAEIQHSTWLPLTDFQFVLWMSHLFERSVKKLNVVGRRRVLGKLNQAALNLALNALIQKHDVLSYAIHRILPLQKRRSKVMMRWFEVDLAGQCETAVEQRLSASMHALSTYQGWSRTKPLIIAKLFHLSDTRTELQIAMPHLIADQQSLGIFFQDLSDAYLFYSKQNTDTACLDVKPFEAYIRHEQHHLRSSLQTDATFWAAYLKEVDLFAFPQNYVVSNPKKQASAYSSFFPIGTAQLKKWRKLCIQHHFTLNDLMCAAIGVALKARFGDEIRLPQQLFVNQVKSTREDPRFDEMMGCFLRTQTVKLDLAAGKDLVDSAKQVQQSALETAPHQAASGLIKFASIGQLDEVKKGPQVLLMSGLSKVFRRMKHQPYYLSAPILSACRRLAAVNRQRGFVINVNIWNSFFGKRHEVDEQLFGLGSEPVGLNQKDIFTINEVLDVCLLKDAAKDQSFLVLSANLTPAFREELGEMVLEILS